MQPSLARPFSLLLFGFASMLPLSSSAQSTLSATTTISASGLQDDVTVLQSALEQLHPGLYRYNTKQQMDAAFGHLREDFGHDQTLEQAFLRLSRFTAQVRCGHTFPNPYNQSDEVRAALFNRAGKLPFLFRWIGGRMIVTRDLTPAHTLPAGTEVLSINHVTAREIQTGMLPLVSADGANDAKRVDLTQEQGTTDYENPDLYLPMLFPGWTSPFHLRVKRPLEEHPASIRVASLTTAERKAVLATTHPDPDGTQPMFTLRYLPDGAAVLTMPTWVMFHSHWDWKSWLNTSLDEVISRHAPALVIDLRGNTGGDDVGHVILSRLRPASGPHDPFTRLIRYRKVPSELVPYLSTWDPSFKDWGAAAVDLPSSWPTAPPVPYLRQVPSEQEDHSGNEAPAMHFSSKVFVLIDASNSSATFGFARAVQEEHLGTLVGEPTGGNKRGINGGAFFFLTLPHSGVEIDLPLIGYFPAEQQPDAGLNPDLPVSPSIRDIADSYDPAIVKVLQQLAAQH